MNERELDRAKVETYKRVVEFARDAVEKEKKELEKRLLETRNAISDLVSLGVSVTDRSYRNLSEELKKIEQLLAKVDKDLRLLNSILNSFNNSILNHIDPVEKAENINNLVNIQDDINFVRSEAARDTRKHDLLNEIDNITRTYNLRIQNEPKKEKREALEKEKIRKISTINNRIKKLDGYISMDDSIKQARINDLIRRQTELNAKPEKTSEEQLEEAILLVKPLFIKYSNNYGGQDITVKEYGGESMFKSIMKTTDTYAKMGKDIEKLERKLAAANASNLAKGREAFDVNQVLKGEVSRTQMLPYRIRDMKKKQASIKNEQKLIMLKRQQAIDKKNHQISRLEARTRQLREEASQHNARNVVTKGIESVNTYRKQFKAWRTDIRIKVLRKKPIFLASARNIVLTEKIKDSFLKKATDEHGNWDSRTWQERAIERLEKESDKRGKSL